MKKQLIAVGLAGLLTIPAVSFGAEMAGPSLYGSFRTGIIFGDGDSDVSDIVSRWGIKGSHEVSEGLTASYKYEAKMNTTSAVSSGDNGRLSNISLSGGFGTVSLGQIWSASAIHYGFAVDPSYYNGVFGGASYRQGNSVSYSSSAGDVSFQIDKVTGDGEKVEVGASAAFGPIGVGVGYSRSNVDESSFTGVAISAGAAGVNLTIGLGSSDSATGAESDTSILHVGGSLGDTGVSYALQVANSDGDGSDQNLIVLTNSLGSGASLIFEHLDPGGDGDSSSLLGLKVDF
jgi:predicted porin